MDTLLLKSDHNGSLVDHKFISGFHLTEQTYASTARFPMHTHENACFCLVTRGGYMEVYRNSFVECKPAQVNFRPPGEAHADNIGINEVACFIIEPDRPWLKRIERISGLAGPKAYERNSLVWLAIRVQTEFRQTDEFTPIAIEGLMLEFAAELARVGTERRLPHWLVTVRDTLHERFSERLALEDLAESVGVHPVYLASTFRKHFNSSVGDYIRRVRVEYAGRKLIEGETPLAEVALDAGFAHQSHFTRAFKRITGFTPAAFRASHR